MVRMTITTGIPIPSEMPKYSFALMEMPFEAGDDDDEEVGDCMVDIFGVCEGNKVVVELINVGVAVTEGDSD